MRLLVVGAGYTGSIVARRAADEPGWLVAGTRRTPTDVATLRATGLDAFCFDAAASAGATGAFTTPVDDALRAWLAETTHVLLCAAPERDAPLRDAVFDALQPLLCAPYAPRLQWLGYLSSIGVYGDHQGAWVDEEADCHSEQERSVMRLAAERQWQALAAARRLPISVLRLSGIYGPGRNALEQARQGRSRMLIKPGQVFNRIHVEDIAEAAVRCMQRRYDGLLNISDDEPAPPQDVIRHAHALLDLPAPPAVDFAGAVLSPMARSFYGENKRVDNRRSKAALDLQYRYPDYRQGLASLLPTLPGD